MSPDHVVNQPVLQRPLRICCKYPSVDIAITPLAGYHQVVRYRKRVVDAELARRLSSTGAVVIEGPKACGKTATARQLSASEVLLDIDANARRALSIDPSLVLDGPAPRLIDE